ncbi:MAG: LytR/AlgR family response regulator transcription factor [Terriglobia bacterium]
MSAPRRIFSACLVDDEPLALKRLARLLEETRRVEIAAAVTDAEAALAYLSAHPVDVLFLDIQMPGLNGFELLGRLPSEPMVIFTTAYDQYALEAFQVNSADYLLKPVEPERLARALDKVERWTPSSDSGALHAQLDALFAHLAANLVLPDGSVMDSIPSRVGGHIQLLDLNQITHFAAEDKLTYAVIDGKRRVVDDSITALEQKLARRRFVRIHRSTLVNLSWVKELHSWFGGQMVVRLKSDDKTDLVVARDRVRTLKEKLGLK